MAGIAQEMGTVLATTETTTLDKVGDIRPDSLDQVSIRRAFRKINFALQDVSQDSQDTVKSAEDGTFGYLKHDSLEPGGGNPPYPGVMFKDGVGADYSTIKWNLTATVDPAVTDDVDSGYGKGSLWANTVTEVTFLCVKADAGSAVWIPTIAIVSPTAPPLVTGTLWLDTSESLSGDLGLIRELNTITTSTVIDTTYDVILVDTTSGAVTITLPAASSRTGKTFDIKKIDAAANAVTVDADGSETIDGSLTKVINTQYNGFTIVSDASNWHMIG